ncbi:MULTISPECIES: hypothetical protein [unclassified Comamonas]|uniref:terminase small subunit-like protein n=1 Tax=unclassified Comamonas TaxID=2638500 RepID=UPI0028AFD79D|nr:hypothetical protein [Comamonas sp.]
MTTTQRAGKAATAKVKKPARKSTPKPKTKAALQREWFARAGALDEFMAYVCAGGHLNGFCKLHGFSYTGMLEFIHADSSRSEMYARARQERADLLADEIVDIADEDCTVVEVEDGVTTVGISTALVNRNKLRVDARKWVASKLKPRVYGDKLELSGEIGTPTKLSDDQLLERLQRFGVNLPGIVPKAEGAQ